MREWLLALWAACIADPVLQYAITIGIISALVNFYSGWGLGLRIDVELARQRAGRAVNPVPEILWVAVSNVTFVISVMVTAAGVLKHIIFD